MLNFWAYLQIVTVDSWEPEWMHYVNFEFYCTDPFLALREM